MRDPRGPVHRGTAEHYVWGDACDGWILRPGNDLLIIEERMPPGAREERHVHARAEQFFYVLSGTLSLEMDGVLHPVGPGMGMAVPTGAAHQARNDGDADVVFLVVSAPTSRGDRQSAPR
ncbi:MAG: cupin domain-containing protein [Roseovarius sp.]